MAALIDAHLGVGRPGTPVVHGLDGLRGKRGRFAVAAYGCLLAERWGWSYGRTARLDAHCPTHTLHPGVRYSHSPLSRQLSGNCGWWDSWPAAGACAPRSRLRLTPRAVSPCAIPPAAGAQPACRAGNRLALGKGPPSCPPQVPPRAVTRSGPSAQSYAPSRRPWLRSQYCRRQVLPFAAKGRAGWGCSRPGIG